MSLLFVFAALCPLLAQAADTAASTGSVTGRVFNAHSGTFLNNARVTVEGTSLEAFTDDSGTYRLRNVPAGTQRLRVRYTGQTDLIETVEVKGDIIANADFSFNTVAVSADAESLVLDQFIVKEQAFKNAQELATNEERYSTNIKSVVALDSLGYMTDGNIGDFVRFLPGISLGYGSSEGAMNNPDNAMSVGVRGFGASDTSITVDGMPISSAALNGDGQITRAAALDALSINNASRLEIIKVATPDMPQDSPGGSINLVTRGAFELPKATYSVTVALNGNFNQPDIFKRIEGPYGKIFTTVPNVRASMTLPLTKKIGFTASVATDRKYSYTYNTNMRDYLMANRTVTIEGTTYQIANARGGIRVDNPVVDRYEKVDNQWVEERYSGSLRLDWKPFDGLELRLNGQFSTFENLGVFRRTQFRYVNSNVVSIADWGPDYVTGRTRTATWNPGYSFGISTEARDREGFNSSGYITAKYRKGPWAIDARATASEAYVALVDRKNGHFSVVDAFVQPWRMDLTGINKGIVGSINLYNQAGQLIDYGQSANWNRILNPTFEARSSDTKHRDLKKLYQLDIARSLDFLPFDVTLKVGGISESLSAHKWGDGTTYKMRYTGPSANVPTNAELQSDFATEAGRGYNYAMYWPDASKIYDFYQRNPQWFDPNFYSTTENVNYAATNYQSRISAQKGLTTTKSSWYGMATANLFNNRLKIVTGARQERKEQEGYNLFHDNKANFIKDASGLAIYRDSIYTAGVTFNGANNPYPIGDPRRDPNVIITDTALRARMAAAGVQFIPGALELNPNGTPGEREKNLKITQLARYLRNIDTSLTQPWTPQVQVAYKLSDQFTIQAAWSNETRIPDIEAGSTGIISGNTGFEIVNQPDNPDPSVLGGDGLIRVSNSSGVPEEITSYNLKLAYYPQNGGGKYAVSWFYKVSNKSWETLNAYPGDSDYDSLLTELGLSPTEYDNYTLNYSTATDRTKTIRRGLEFEATQNLGIIGAWAKGLDAYMTFTWRPAAKVTPNDTVLGWTTDIPDRNKWTGGISYSARRFSIQMRGIYEESGITHRSTVSVTMPDGTTTRNIRTYRLNKRPAEINIQGNYVLSKTYTLFASFNRVISPRIYTQEADAMTGMIPGYATYRTMQERGVAFAAGVTASF